MPKIMAAGQTFEVAQATNLREALLAQDIHLYSAGAQILNCHGHGMCGTCLVQVEGDVSAPTGLETMRMALPPNSGHKERRLACQTKVLGDVRVTKYDGHFGEGETVCWTPEQDSAEAPKAPKSNNMNNTIVKTDIELKTDVLSELKYEPTVKVTDIGVLVKDGTVTLNGYATNYGEKWDALHAVKRVAGVKAIADEITVNLPSSLHRTDGDLAAAAADKIDWSTTIPAAAVVVTVREGWITLSGEVEWWYQKNTAEQVVQHLAGVKGVSNLITIRPKLITAEVETAIKSAFKRNALLDANQIHVETSDNKVILHGMVRNFAELEEAERVAWAAPGVLSVDNQLTVKLFSFAQ